MSSDADPARALERLQHHIKAKTCQLKLKLKNIYWLMNEKSKLYIYIYKAIPKPVWTYSIKIWGCSKPSNTKILQTYQSKTLRMINWCPLICLKSNIAQRPQNSICT
jgi:hypothetical protein